MVDRVNNADDRSLGVLSFCMNAAPSQQAAALAYIRLGVLSFSEAVRDKCKAKFEQETPEGQVAMVKFMVAHCSSEEILKAGMALMDKKSALRLSTLVNHKRDSGLSMPEVNETIKSIMASYRGQGVPKPAVVASGPGIGKKGP